MPRNHLCAAVARDEKVAPHESNARTTYLQHLPRHDLSSNDSLKAGGSKTGREKNGVSDWGVFLGHSVERNEVSRTLKVNME